MASQYIQIERAKWRKEFDSQIQRTREDAAKECSTLQRECKRDLKVCQLGIADLKRKCEADLRRVRESARGSAAASSRADMPPSEASLASGSSSPETDNVCDNEARNSVPLDGLEASRKDEGSNNCGDAVGMAVAAERRRLQEAAFKSRRRAIESLLQGDAKGAAEQVAAVVCVSKEDCNMERVIVESINRGQKAAEEDIACGLRGTCKVAPKVALLLEFLCCSNASICMFSDVVPLHQLQGAIEGFWNDASTCIFSGTGAKSDFCKDDHGTVREN